MRYWLMRRSPHYSDIRPSLVGQPYEYDKIYADHRLKPGDILFLIAAQGELYGWGYVTNSVVYQDSELGKEALRVTVLHPVVRQNMVQADAIKRVPALARLFENSDLNLIDLKPHQVNSFNRLIRSQGVEAPADIEEYKNPDMHLSRLIKIYEAANGSRSKLIELMDVLGDEVISEQDAWDEADYMKEEGWIEIVSDNGPPLIRLAHNGVKTAQKHVGNSTNALASSPEEKPHKNESPRNDLLDDARRIARYLYDNKILGTKTITIHDLREALDLSPDNFDVADDYLLGSKYCEGTMGGESGFRWLTNQGVGFATDRGSAMTTNSIREMAGGEKDKLIMGQYELIKPLVGYKEDIESQLSRYPFDKNVFLMMKFRESNQELGEFIIENLNDHGLRGVRADLKEWNITGNVYNPIAVLYCCKYGIALFDEPEEGQAYSPNVAYELGIMHYQRKNCLILRHKQLPPAPFDLVKDLYQNYERDLQVRKIIKNWIEQISDK